MSKANTDGEIINEQRATVSPQLQIEDADW